MFESFGAVSLCQLIVFVMATEIDGYLNIAVTQSNLVLQDKKSGILIVDSLLATKVQLDKAHNLKISAVFHQTVFVLAFGAFAFEHCLCRARFEATPLK